jgi:trigger factor
MEASARLKTRRAVTGPLLEKLLEAHEIPLPAVLVDRESEHLYGEAKSAIDRSGVPWETYLQEQAKTEDALREEYRAEAEKRVRTSLLIEAIAKAENITATNADVEAEVASLARQYGQPREAILEMLRSNFNALVDGIVRTKTIEFLLDNAKIGEASRA